MQPARLSFTRNKDLFCPHRFSRVNMRGEQEAKADYTVRGSQLHEIAADYARRLDKINRPSARKLLGRVFDDHTKRLPDDEVFRMTPIIRNFGNWFKLPQGYTRLAVEHEMAVARDGTPLRLDEALHPAGTAKVDCFTGIADLVVEMGVDEARITDYKMGYALFDMWQAGENLQGKGYAYLWMMLNPQCERVVFTLFAPQFMHISTAEFTRDRLIPEFKEHLARQWERVDMLRETYGDGRWPEQADMRCCNFCRLTTCALKMDMHLRGVVPPHKGKYKCS